MELLKRFVPISGLGILCLGFLFGDAIFRINQIELLYIAGFLGSIILYSIHSRWKYFFLGLLVFPAFYFTQERNIQESQILLFSQKDLSLLQSNYNTVRITPIKEVKKNYWEISIGESTYKPRMILKAKFSSPEIPILDCPTRFWKYHIREYEGEYFDFLQQYGNAYLTIYTPKCQKVGSNTDFRRAFRQEIKILLERGKIRHTAKDIAMGLIFGDSGYLSASLKSAAREGGILHLFAASGLHIGILTGFLLLFCQKIPFLDYFSEKIIPILIGFLYLWMLNFPVSLTRAFCFAFLATLAKILFKKVKSSDMVLIAATVVCAFDYPSYLTLSFLLSFGAVCGILFLKDPIEKTMFGTKKNLFIENLTLSISASIGTFPSLVYWFHSFSFGSILINLVLVPLTGFLLPVLYLSLLWEYFRIPIVSEVFWIFSDILLHVLAFLSTYLGETIGFYREMENIQPVLLGFGVYIFILTLSIWIAKPWEENIEEKRVWRTLIASFLSISSFCLGTLAGIYLLPGKNHPQKAIESIIASQDFYIFLQNRNLYIGGDCQYKGKVIYQFLKNTKQKAETVHIEKENCLQTAFQAKEEKEGKVVLYSSELNPFATALGVQQETKTKIPRKFEKESGEHMIFFAPHKEDPFSLSKSTFGKKGKIVLQFPYKSKDSKEDWNRLKSMFGIGKDWEFVIPEEIGEL
jgi:ComEC/Rec2-related protein